jgi:hypothetical protein
VIQHHAFPCVPRPLPKVRLCRLDAVPRHVSEGLTGYEKLVSQIHLICIACRQRDVQPEAC